MRCASCGFDMQNPSKFCPGCGKPFEEAKSKRIKIACPYCHQKISVTNKWCGREMRCPGCKHTILVPNEIPAVLKIKKAKTVEMLKPRSIDDEVADDNPKTKTVVCKRGKTVILGKPDRRAVMIAVMSVFIALLGLGVLSLGGYMIYNLLNKPAAAEATQNDVGF